MGALTFYFDKNCTEKATEKLKEIFRENGLIGVSGFTGYSDNRNKKWICYNLSNRMTEEFQVIDENLNNKVNDIVRNFDWESIGVTGFEEAIEVEIKVFGLTKVEDAEDTNIRIQEIN